MFNKHNFKKNQFMLNGSFKRRGYDWWWHSFTALDEFNNEVPFFLEFFITNPKKEFNLGLNNHKPSFLMVKFGHWGKDHIELNYFVDLKNVLIKKDLILKLVVKTYSYLKILVKEIFQLIKIQ